MAGFTFKLPLFDSSNGMQYRRELHGTVEKISEWCDGQESRNEAIQGLIAERVAEMQDAKTMIEKLRIQGGIYRTQWRNR